MTLLWIALLGTLSAAQEKTAAEKDKGLPLETTRRIEFETDEATWLSLDVAPDGESLVLEILGDLYTLPIAGGEARPITSGPAFDSQPRFSPDGSRIAFLSDRDGSENVWIAGADGSDPRKLSEGTDAEYASPAWSADGSYVIASRTNWGQATYELFLYHVSGGVGVQLTKAKPEPKTPRNQRVNVLGAVASPDGRYLYYSRRTGGFQYNATFPMWQIARLDLVTGDEDVLTQESGSAIRPSISPDGKHLVYGTRLDAETGLRIRSLESGEDRWLVYPIQRDDQESAFTRDLLPGYTFTPDGSAVITTSGGKILRVDVASGTASPIPFRAKIAQELGPRLHFPRRVEDGPLRARLIQDPSVSPDGRSLAFSSLTRLYVMDLPAGVPRALSFDAPAFHPVWSPDGASLAFVTWSRGEGHVYKIGRDGGAPERLTTTAAFYSDPVWAPDGRRIVALRASAYDRVSSPVDFGAPRGMDLVWLPAEGGEARLILPARGLGKPHFTSDPERIYLYLSAGTFGTGAAHGLVSVRFDGTDRRQHLKVVGPGIYLAEEPVGADDARISPDGKWALAHVANQLYLVAVPPVGGEGATVDVTKPTVPARKLTDVGADYFGWSRSANGEPAIAWSIGSTLYRRPLSGVSFEPASEDAPFSPAESGADVEPSVVAIEVDRAAPSGTVVLRGARVVTMRGDEVLESADVVVTANRIAAVGASVPVPEGARVVDVRGMTIVPGFVDTHAHWFEIRRGILDVDNWSFLANLAYGVTAGLDVQTSTNDMFAYQDLVDAGVVLGPRAYSTGPGIFSDNRFQSLDQTKSVLRRYKEHYRTRNLKSYIVGNRKQRQLVVQAAKELELMPTTEGALDLKLDLTHVLDGFSGNEHSLPIVPLYRDVVELVARSGIGYTPTLLVAYGGPFAENYYYTTTEVHDDPKLNRFLPHNLVDANTQRRPWFREAEHVFPRTAAQAAKIVRAGGRVGVGSHGQLQGLGYHWELWSIASGGLTPLEALRAATLHGAEIIGLSEDLGSLEPGKLADLVVLEKNPLEDVRNTNSVRLVMKNGELYDGDTLDRIWPAEKKLAPLWWWDSGPRRQHD